MAQRKSTNVDEAITNTIDAKMAIKLMEPLALVNQSKEPEPELSKAFSETILLNNIRNNHLLSET